MTPRRVAGAYLALLLVAFLAKMVEVNGIFEVSRVVGIVLMLISVMIAAMVVLLDD